MEKTRSLQSDRKEFDPSALPIWEVFDEILKDLPEEELRKLPVDGAEQHDHYIYGTPKKRP